MQHAESTMHLPQTSKIGITMCRLIVMLRVLGKRRFVSMINANNLQ